MLLVKILNCGTLNQLVLGSSPSRGTNFTAVFPNPFLAIPASSPESRLGHLFLTKQMDSGRCGFPPPARDYEKLLSPQAAASRTNYSSLNSRFRISSESASYSILSIKTISSGNPRSCVATTFMNPCLAISRSGSISRADAINPRSGQYF